MMWLWATLVSACVFGIGSFLLKVGSHRNYSESSMLFGLYLAGSAIFLCILFVKGGLVLNWWIIVFSIIVGLGSYYGNSFLIKAYDLGPACLTSPLMNISVLLVIIVSAVVYKESLTNWQYFGVACMVIAASLLGCNFNSLLIKSRMWLAFVCLAIIFLFMREGGLKIAYETGLDNLSILFFAYLLGASAAITMLINNYQANSNHHSALLLGSIVGLFSAIGMGLLAYALTCGPASIIVPIFSVRNIITVLLIVFFFKERLLILQWISVGLMITGVAFVA